VVGPGPATITRDLPRQGLAAHPFPVQLWTVCQLLGSPLPPSLPCSSGAAYGTNASRGSSLWAGHALVPTSA
jgi:hypothetical protein